MEQHNLWLIQSFLIFNQFFPGALFVFLALFYGAKQDHMWGKTRPHVGQNKTTCGAKHDHMCGKARPFVGQYTTRQLVLFCPTSGRKVPHIKKHVTSTLIQVGIHGYSHWSRIAPGYPHIPNTWSKSRRGRSYSLFPEIC